MPATGSLPELCAVVFRARLSKLQKFLSDPRIFRLLHGQAFCLLDALARKRFRYVIHKKVAKIRMKNSAPAKPMKTRKISGTNNV